MAPFLEAKYPNIKNPFINSGCLVGPVSTFARIFEMYPIDTYIDD
jgi:hypothetical protein